MSGVTVLSRGPQEVLDTYKNQFSQNPLAILLPPTFQQGFVPFSFEYLIKTVREKIDRTKTSYCLPLLINKVCICLLNNVLLIGNNRLFLLTIGEIWIESLIMDNL